MRDRGGSSSSSSSSWHSSLTILVTNSFDIKGVNRFMTEKKTHTHNNRANGMIILYILNRKVALWRGRTTFLKSCSSCGGNEYEVRWYIPTSSQARSYSEPSSALLQIRLLRGEFVDESGCSMPDWIGFIRAARNSQEQNLEAVSDLPGGQVYFSLYPTFTPKFLNRLFIFFFILFWTFDLTPVSSSPPTLILHLKIFYRALREIPAGEELCVWYSNALAQWYDIPTTATPTHDEKGKWDYE